MGVTTAITIGTFGGEAISMNALAHYLGRFVATCIYEYREFERVTERHSFEAATVHVICVSEMPNQKSYASAILLKNYYETLDIEKSEKYDWRKWLAYRYKYLRRIKDERGELVCEYCGKRHLHIEKHKSNSNLATIDHIKPIAMGGHKYDDANLAVACFSCNQKKGTKDYTMLMMRRRHPFKYYMLHIKQQICTFSNFLGRFLKRRKTA